MFPIDSLPIGTEIVVAGFRARDGSNQAVGASITLTNGETLFLGGAAPGAAGPGSRR